MKNRLKLYDINEPEDAQNDFISETLLESQNEINRLMEEFKTNQVPDGQNKYNYLYDDEKDYYFMNPETFEQINIRKDTVGEKGKMLKENLEVKINFYNEIILGYVQFQNKFCHRFVFTSFPSYLRVHKWTYLRVL